MQFIISHRVPFMCPLAIRNRVSILILKSMTCYQCHMSQGKFCFTALVQVINSDYICTNGAITEVYISD